jgi:hypothetical protein
MNYYRLPDFLTQKKKDQLLDLAYSLKENDWYHHVNTQTGTQSPLRWYGLDEQFFGKKISLMLIYPNQEQKWHTDIKEIRNTAMIYPLSDNYAPCHVDDDLVDFPAFINVQVKHAVFNNNKPRINLQASFIESIEDCVNMFHKDESYELHTS